MNKITKLMAIAAAATLTTGTAYAQDPTFFRIGTGSAGGVSFSDFLRDRVQDAADTVKSSEAMSARAVTGEADITEVVQAITEAELTLETVVAVRDRMISAYQDIMRMPI